MNKKIWLFAFVLVAQHAAQASTVTLVDTNLSVVDGSSITSGNLAVRWGTYSGGVFSPIGGNTYQDAINSGYVNFDEPPVELSVALTQSNNDLITAGTQLYLAVYNASFDANYSSSYTKAILTDTAWLATTYLISGGDVTYSLDSTASAVFGGYSFNTGNQVITLASEATIPEPSTYAAIFGAASLGFCVWRKRRKAA